MDTATERRIDEVVEDEIRRGFCILDVPADLVAELRAAKHLEPRTPVFQRVRLSRPTPRTKRLIGETVQRSYHKDIQAKALLSNAQLRQFNIERGEWSVAQEERLKVLNEETQKLMMDLHLEGFDPRSEWVEKLRDLATVAQTWPETLEVTEAEKAAFAERFLRWFNYSPADREKYTIQYGDGQAYSEDRDQQWLLENAPSVTAAEAVQEIDELRHKLRRYMDLLGMVQERRELQEREARIYAESLESRRDSIEELAKVYYCTQVVDEAGLPTGPMTPAFDGVYDLPEPVLQWLLTELSSFLNGITPEVRKYLEHWGFVRAPQASGSSDASGASLAEPSSKTDSPASTGGVPTSSASPTPTN